MRNRKFWALHGFSALCVTCILLGAPWARADNVTATVQMIGLNGCGVTTTLTDPATASVGPLTCNGTTLQVFSDTGSASGSWVTGTASISISASQGPRGLVLTPQAVVDLNSTGAVSLAPGMNTAQVTFGANSITAAANGSGPGTGAQASAVLDMTLTDLTTGASAFTGACIGTPPPTPCLAVPSTLPPLTLTVSNNDMLQLSVHMIAQANVCCDNTSASASVAIDPLFLDLPAGVTYDSGIPGFLTGTAPVPTPEPSSSLLLLLGLAALGGAARAAIGSLRDPELQVRT
jgi:PEP-CTERM motif